MEALIYLNNKFGVGNMITDFAINMDVSSKLTNLSLQNESASHLYELLFTELADERINDKFLIRTPIPILIIISIYLYFVTYLGPKMMEHRKPYKLKNVLLVYNFLQVLLSVWMFAKGFGSAWFYHYSWKCEPIDYSRSPVAMQIVSAAYVYYLAKISELLDTVFFVLRKKQSQVSFLHVYHHTMMPLASYVGTKYIAGGHGTFLAFINSFIHIIMYSYYFLAGLGPRYQKYLWWKKYITTMQMVQFCIGSYHALQVLFYNCGYPKWTIVWVLPNMVVLFSLFNQFYNQSYVASSKAECLQQTDDNYQKHNQTIKKHL